jgi:hypothetical protein
MNEITSVVASAGTEKEKFPFRSEAVPIVVPFTNIVAPGIAALFSSNTLPVTVFCCANRAADDITTARQIRKVSLKSLFCIAVQF